MKVKIEVDGVKFEGERADVSRLLEAMGKKVPNAPYYYSKSHGGLVPVTQMHTGHVKNALLKIYRKFVDDLSNETDPQVLYGKIRMGPSDPEFVNLYHELKTRYDKLT